MTSRRPLWIIAACLAILIGFRAWDWWCSAPDPSPRIAQLEAEAETLAQAAEAARRDAIEARAEYHTVAEQLATERRLRAAERQSLETEILRLSVRREEVTQVIEAPVEPIADATDEQLRERLESGLARFAVSAPDLRLGDGGTVLDRVAVEAAVTCVDRYGLCVQGLTFAAEEAARLSDLVELEREEGRGWRIEATKCNETVDRCEAAIQAAAQLDANRQQLLVAQAERIRQLERKAKRARVTGWVTTIGAGVVGYTIGRH